MPTAAPRPCAFPGCGRLVKRGRCPEHALARERARGTHTQRGYGVRHEGWRRLVLARDPICVDPDRRHPDEPRPSLHADHITPLPRPNWWDGDWSLENGQGLCPSCHTFKTSRERRR